MLSIFTLILISIITINAEYTCPSSLPCTVDCSDVATDCATKIDGTAATSLTVLCNEAATSCDTILLPNATAQSSSITCSASSSCNGAEIYYFGDATNNNIELICTLVDDACYNTKIFANDAGNFKLDCDGVECGNLKINVENVDNVDINCKGSSSYYGGCYGSSIGAFLVSAQNVTTVNITCEGYRGCNKLRIAADRAGSVSIHARPEGLYDGEFITKNVQTSVEITCIGNGSYAGCTGSSSYPPEFYLPDDLSKFTLNCYGTGCKNIKLVKNDGLSAIGNANINFNGCGQCDANPTKSSGCLKVTTECGDTDYFPYGSQWYCGTSPYCNCDTVATAFEAAYIEDFSDPNCISPPGTILCGNDCNVDCSSESCAGNIIAATQSNTLTVTCPTADSCDATYIYAPLSSSSSANIVCSGNGACGASSSANRFVLFARNSYDVSVTGNPNGMTGSYGPIIYAENIQNSFSLTCIGNGTYSVGCDEMDIYVPTDLSKFMLNCYGTGCGGEMNLYSDSGLQAITDSNINWNGCIQCNGDDPGYSCLRKYIYTRCEETGTNVYGSIYRDTTCYQSTSKCGCDELAAAFASAFDDNTADSNCIVPAGTIQCTGTCTIDCSTQTCAGNIIDGTQATSLTVRCETINSCEDTVIYPSIGTSTSTTIICAGTDRTSRSQCGCSGDFQVLGNNAYDLIVTAMPYGLLSGEIYAKNIQNSFRLNCIGNGTGRFSYKHYACDSIDVYVPVLDADLSKFSMNCYGTGCGTVWFRKPDGFANIGNANINFNGCLQCNDGTYDAAHTCLGYIRTYCSDCTTNCNSFGTQSNNGYSCGTGTIYCSCDAVGLAFENGYKDDTSDSNCILGGGAIICTPNEDCVVDCSTQSCAGNIIAASEATGLTVTCNTNNSCDGTDISLPTSITSTSTITCSATEACNDLKATFGGDASANPTNHNINLICNTVDESCKSVTINADKAGTIGYTCDGIKCYDVTILANNANIVALSCDGPSLIKTGNGCIKLTVNTTDVSSVTLTCSGHYGCSATTVYANRATSVILDLNGDAGSSNEFYANKAGLIDITCYGGFDGRNNEFSGCDSTEFYVPDTVTASNFKLTCYGKACDDMSLYSANGFKSATSDNFVINGCSDCTLGEEDIDAYTEDYCMSSLGFGCIDPTNDAEDFVSYPDEYNGYDCGLTVKYDCGCAQVATVLNNAFSEDAEDDNCASSLYESDWEEEEEDNSGAIKVYIILVVILIIVGCCAAGGYARRFYLKHEWEERKSTKDELKSAIDGGDTNKQSEYDEICKDTPDEFEEPEMKHWSDYALWYALDPFFGLFFDRFDKYFVYIGWFGEAIDVFVTFWIIGQLLSPYAAFACCSYSYAGANCNPQQGMKEDLSLITTQNGWCVVDGTPCVNKLYYDPQDPTALFECFGGDTPQINKQWNDDICGEAARKDAVRGNSAWIIVVLVFKLIKLGWDYYIQIVEFMGKKKFARENLRIVNEFKEKHPEWEPDDEKQPNIKTEAKEVINKEDDDNAGDVEMETKNDNEAEVNAGDNNDDDNIVSYGPVLIDEEEIRVCGCIAGGIGTDNKYYLYCLMILNFLGVTLALAVLGGLEASGGISTSGCEYSIGDYDSACYNVASCANPGSAASGSIDFSSGSDGETQETPVYAIINKNVDLEGPAILAIFAMLIGYIAYVPWIREKINEMIIKKGWREGDTEKDALGDYEMWSGLF